MRRFGIIIEHSPAGFGAYVPDLPGCVAAADTREEVVMLIREAIDLHVHGMLEDGLAVPDPSSRVEYVDFSV